MKVLFVSSGNSKTRISPIVKNQGESLRKKGIEIEYFTIIGKGIKDYLQNILILRKYLKNNEIDIIHAHYYLSAYITTISSIFFSIPIVTSLMGGNRHRRLIRKITYLLYRFVWVATIVKSDRMRITLNLHHAYVIPNGINFNLFSNVNMNNAIKITNFNPEKINILWISDPNRFEKNFVLAQKATDLLKLNIPNIVLHIINDVQHKEIPYYMHIADVLLLTSLWEGSPNAIKEAMASNLSIVSTDVGDIKELIRGTEGCYITSFDYIDVSEKLHNAIKFGKRTKGKVKVTHLDETLIANRIIEVYHNVTKIYFERNKLWK